MSAVDRRGLLRSLAALPLIGGSLATTAPAAAAPSELMQLGQRLDEAMAAWEAAQQRFQATHAEFERRRPPIPAEAFPADEPRHFTIYLDEVRDIEDRPLPYTGGRPVRILTAATALDFLEDVDGRSRRARQIRARLPAIQAYEQEIANLRSELSADEIVEARYWAKTAVEKTAKAIMEAPAASLPDLAVKARALLAHARTEDGCHTWLAYKHTQGFAAEVIALAGS